MAFYLSALPNCPKCGVSLEDPVFKEGPDKKYWLRVNVKWERGFLEGGEDG